ncbi:hypothetical protein IPC927_09830 [Pseudomonas aeruginosa]|nr:hypothetical protein IPC927_09830 [Pseudomonas aeruginosa]
MDLLCTYFITQACVFFQCSLFRCFEFMESVYKSAACYAEVAMKYGHGWSSGGRIRWFGVAGSWPKICQFLF